IIAFHILDGKFREICWDSWELHPMGDLRNVFFYQIIPNHAYVGLYHAKTRLTWKTEIRKKLKETSSLNIKGNSQSDEDEDFKDAPESFYESSKRNSPQPNLEKNIEDQSYELVSDFVRVSPSKTIVGSAAEAVRERALQSDSDDEMEIEDLDDNEEEEEIVEFEYHQLETPFGFPIIVSVNLQVSQEDLQDYVKNLLVRKGQVQIIKQSSRMREETQIRIFIEDGDDNIDPEEFEFDQSKFTIGYIGWLNNLSDYDEDKDHEFKDIPAIPKPPVDVAECIAQHLKEEPVDWSCEKCRKKHTETPGEITVDSTKKLDLWSLPSQILVVHLKRFAQNHINPLIWNKRDALITVPGVYGAER
ncbi:hypothetical protein HK096_010775, partial [Nowakowskiella sp. JEL0078]